MLAQDDDAQVYNINKDYRVVRIRGNKCSLFFKNKQNQLLASLEGCQDVFTQLIVAGNQKLSELEKGYLLSFIRAKKYSISKEVAAILGVSIVRYLDGREEYLSEKQLKKRLAKGIDFAKVYIGKLAAHSIRIPADSKDCSYNFSNAEITKLTVEENCSISIDMRDNTFIESLVIGEKFSGSVNLSRTSIESIFINNNCRCNLNIADSKKCFNLQIADIYSGNLNISNCCLYAFGLGYYSYADLMLANNIIKKEIVIGDSFRGGFYATNQNVELMKVGDDCKGWVKLNNQSKDTGVQRLLIGDDFAGSINLSGDESIVSIETGRKNGGKIDASYAGVLDKVKIGKYFNGNIDLSGSAVQNITVAYGASGSVNLKDCHNLKLLQATVDNNLFIDGDMPVKSVKTLENTVYYNFESDPDQFETAPFYKKIFQNTRRMIHDRFL